LQEVRNEVVRLSRHDEMPALYLQEVQNVAIRLNNVAFTIANVEMHDCIWGNHD
jgi:hypothetical protein